MSDMRMKRRMQIIMLRTRARLRGVDLSGLTDEDLDRKMTMAEIRSGFAFFGCDTSHLTDAELSERVIEGSKMIARIGITTEEALEGVKNFQRLMWEANQLT